MIKRLIEKWLGITELRKRICDLEEEKDECISVIADIVDSMESMAKCMAEHQGVDISMYISD